MEFYSFFFSLILTRSCFRSISFVLVLLFYFIFEFVRNALNWWWLLMFCMNIILIFLVRAPRQCAQLAQLVSIYVVILMTLVVFFFIWLIEMRMNKKKIKHTTEFTLKIGIKTVKFDRYMQIEHKNYNNNNNQLHGQWKRCASQFHFWTIK